MVIENYKSYKILSEEIERIVTDNDPAGLIEGGAPIDEYAAEVPKAAPIPSPFI